MFAQLAKALAQFVVRHVVKWIGGRVAAATLKLVEATNTKVEQRGEEVTVEVDPGAIVGAVAHTVVSTVKKVVTHPRVTAFIRSIPEPVLLFLRIFAVGVGQALFETITSRLFGDREVQSEGVV